MRASEQVKKIEERLERASLARRVCIDKVSSFVAGWNTPGGLPANREAAIKPLEDLLTFLED